MVLTGLKLAAAKKKKEEEEKKKEEQVITPPVQPQVPPPKERVPEPTPKYGQVAVDVGGGRSIVVPRAMAEQMAGRGQGLVQETKTQEEALREQQLQKGAELAQTVGQLSPEILAQIERGEIDIGQVLGGGLAAALPGVAGGAVGGAIAGAPVGGIGAIPGAIGGAVIGGVGAFIAGARSNLKSQKSGLVQAGSGSLSDGEKNLRKFVTAANKDPANAAEYNTMFNEQLSYIERDWGILQLDSSGFLKDISGVDATPQRADYQRFYDTTRPFLITQMQMAMLNPDPNKNFLTMEEMGE